MAADVFFSGLTPEENGKLVEKLDQDRRARGHFMKEERELAEQTANNMAYRAILSSKYGHYAIRDSRLEHGSIDH